MPGSEGEVVKGVPGQVTGVRAGTPAHAHRYARWVSGTSVPPVTSRTSEQCSPSHHQDVARVFFMAVMSI